MHGLASWISNKTFYVTALYGPTVALLRYETTPSKKFGREMVKYSVTPRNFTACKLAWVKTNEPKVFEQVYKMLLPGDFAMKLTGEITTTLSCLSEGIFWILIRMNYQRRSWSILALTTELFPR
jgi:hypothetical protein